jgi:hypothetical protein
VTTPGPAKPLADLLRGSASGDYADAVGYGAILTTVDPTTGANVVTDGAVTHRNLPSLLPYAQLTVGRVLLLETPALPIILGRLYTPLVTVAAEAATPTTPTSSRFMFSRATSPGRTEVSDSGQLAAVFTDGSRTVTVLGTDRTFTEQKDDFTDQFDRTLTTGWGQSPGGGTWDDFNGSASDYSVSSGKGRIAGLTTNVSRYVRLNDVVSTYNARMTVTTSTTPAVAANSCSLVGGFIDTSNHYRYRLTFNSTGSVTAAITKNVAGSETTLAGSATVAASGYVANQVWNVRGVFNGTTHSMYAWKSGDAEPGSPTLTVADTTFPSGKLGVRAFVSTGATNAPTFIIDDYSASAVWAQPPAVTHPWRVRLLPAPFNGTVDTAWLTAALADTSPDLLAIATEYITGGSREAGYGPLYAPGRSFDLGHADDGTRQEGSDWNDFLGITGNYPDLTTPATDTAEAHQLGCMDCSGFVRTVFGYRGGLPMCLDTSADFNGLRIPRRSVDQSASGPGTVVVSSVSAAPTDLSQVRPGDVLYWDADTSNPAEEEGQIDHSGIYLGIDSAGEMRFLSSRKVGNGPTMADLGGPSVITGTSLYGRALRRARRF